VRPTINRAVLATACLLAVWACSDATAPNSRVSVMQIAQDNVTLSVGDPVRLRLLLPLPPGYVSQNVRWSSSDPGIVMVRRESATTAMSTAMRRGSVMVHADADGAGDSVSVMVH
jgi:hypothetical protein